MKKHLSQDQEFEIMKLVLDKFLWLGVIIMAYGFYIMINANRNIWFGLAVMMGGAILMLVFMAMIIREYNYSK